MELKSLSIDVKIYGGVHIEDAIKDMVAMARHLRCDVWADLNGLRLLARPNDNPEDVHEAFKEALEKGWSHAATH